MADVKILISAKDEASRVLGQVRGSLEKTRSVVASVGSAFGLLGAVSVGGILAMTKNAIDGLDALNDLSDATGSSIENISALEDVAARTGTSFETVTNSLIRLNQALNAAKPGSAQEQAITALGLSVKELKSLDPADALLKVAVAMGGFAADGNLARISQELFGKSLKEVAPLLKDLAEQGRLNATVTAEQAAEAEKLNKELSNLQKSASDAARSIGGALAESINKTLQLFREGAKEGKSFYRVIVEGQMALIRGWLDTPSNAQEYSQRLGEITEQLKSTNLHETRRAALMREQASLQAKMANAPDFSADNESSAEARRLARRPSLAPLKDKPKGGAAKSNKEQIDDASRALGSYVDGLQRTLEANDKLTESQKALNFLRTLGATGQISQVRELVTGLAAQIDKEKELAETLRSLNALGGDVSAVASENTGLQQRLETIGLTRDGLNALALARLDATIAAEQQLMAEAALANAAPAELALMRAKIELLREQRGLVANEQIATAAAEAKGEADAAAKDYANTLQNDVKSALSNAFRDTKDPVGAFADALGNIVFTRVSTALANSLIDGMLGKAAGGAASTGLMALLGFDGGGYTGAGARSGGLDGKGGFLAMMHPQETVIDHTKKQGTQAQPVTVVQNFTVGDVASVSMVRQAVAGSERRIAAGIGRSMSYGGALS